jgi:hypothetical protein
MGEERKVYRFWLENQKEIDHLEDQGVDGWMESEWVLGDWLGECTVDPVGSG